MNATNRYKHENFSGLRIMSVHFGLQRTFLEMLLICFDGITESHAIFNNFSPHDINGLKLYFLL